MTDTAACEIIADAIIAAAAGYRTRTRLTSRDPLIAVVPPTIPPDVRAAIGQRIALHAIQLETVSPLRGDATDTNGTVKFLIYRVGSFKIEPAAPLSLDAGDVSRDGPSM